MNVTDGSEAGLVKRSVQAPRPLRWKSFPGIHFRYIERRRRIVPVKVEVPGYGELVKNETAQLSQRLA